VEVPAEHQPQPKSGHTAVQFSNKMFIFGGILEITKEQNELVVYDFAHNKFETMEEAVEED